MGLESLGLGFSRLRLGFSYGLGLSWPCWDDTRRC